MNVLFISNLFPDTTQPWRGLDNATALAALREARPDWTIRALCIRPSLKPLALKCREVDEWLKPQYASTLYVPRFGGLNHRFFASAVRRHVGPEKPDVVLCSWLFPDACGTHLAIPDVPQVSIAQGSDVHRYLDMPMRRKAILRMAATSSAIITRSADLKVRLIKAGADEQRVHPVYNGVDHGVFKPADRDEARRELGLDAEGKIVLFVGNFLPVKGIDLLIDACAQVTPRPSLVLIGNGPLEPALRERAAQRGLKVIFAGRHNASSVARHMQAADVICLSSLNEGVPNVLLEAMACGKPVVSTRVGGIHEVVPLGSGLGHLVEGRDPRAYAQSLSAALSVPAESTALAEHAQQFNWPATAEAYARLIESARRR